MMTTTTTTTMAMVMGAAVTRVCAGGWAGNSIGAGGAEHLAGALRVNATLTDLDLGGKWCREGGGVREGRWRGGRICVWRARRARVQGYVCAVEGRRDVVH